MIEVYCYDNEKKQPFKKIFWNIKESNNFINKCKFSKKIEILSIINNSKYYD